MWNRVVMTAAAAVALAAPAMGATTPAKTYFVAQNVKTLNCIVTPTKPNGTTYVMVGTMTFTVVSAALKDMRSEDVCKSPATTVAVKAAPKPATAAQPPPVPPAATGAPSSAGGAGAY